MDSIRRRAIFKFSEEEEEEEEEGGVILDEQEQDEVIQQLRKQSERLNKKEFIGARILVLLSSILQFIQLLALTESNPVLIIFPADLPSTIPFATGFTLLAFFIHLNLAILFHSDDVRTHLQLAHNPKPLSYGMLYTLSAVAPTLSLFLGSPWQTTVWWLVTTMVIFVVQSAMDTIESSSRSISELESKRYVSRGA